MLASHRQHLAATQKNKTLATLVERLCEEKPATITVDNRSTKLSAKLSAKLSEGKCSDDGELGGGEARELKPNNTLPFGVIDNGLENLLLLRTYV